MEIKHFIHILYLHYSSNLKMIYRESMEINVILFVIYCESYATC